MLIINILGLIIFFGGCFSFVIAISLLIIKNRKITNILMALLLFCLCIIQIRAYMMTEGITIKYPFLMLLHFPIIFSMGPLLYLFYQALLDSRFKLNAKKFMHFIPAYILMIVEIALLLLTPYDQSYELRRKIMTALFTGYSSPDILLIPRSFVFSACIYNMSYYFINLKSVLALYSIKKLNKQKRNLLLIFCVCVITPVFFLFGSFLTGNTLYLLIAISIITMLVLFMYFMSQRYPGLMQNITLDLHRKRYERSLLIEVNVEDIHRRLIELMVEEKVYTDDTISLRSLADKLRITPHQLSEFLNEKLNMNFNSFINKYRIKEAMDVLSGDADLSVLQIAYSVGFNSKSAFNNAFLKFTGTTPLNFRNGKTDH